MTTFKVIVSGHLEYNSPRSIEMAQQQFQQRVDVHFKQDVFLKVEDIFPAEGGTVVDIPRFVGQAQERTWRNTIGALRVVTDYAIAGGVHAWKLDEGALVSYEYLEPKGDKTAVQSFLRGRELLIAGKEGEAKEALSQAIDKFERHALAYERRGHINLRLGNLPDALYDFNKSISINPNSPEALFGRAMVFVQQKNFQAAAADFEQVAKNSIPHQAIFWKARRIKAECHLELDEFSKAEFELKLVTKRQFDKTESNYQWQRRAWYNYGRALLALNRTKDAVDALQKAKNWDCDGETVATAEIEAMLMKAQPPQGAVGR